jgi:Neuraminidase (sialidase)
VASDQQQKRSGLNARRTTHAPQPGPPSSQAVPRPPPPLRSFGPSILTRRLVTIDDDATITIQAVRQQRTGPDVSTGSAWFSRSSDGGRTWSPGRLLYDPGKQEVAPLSNVIAVLPHRVLLDVMQVADSASNTQDVMAARSVDGGRTWSRPALIAHGSYNTAMDPDAGTVFASATATPTVKVGPHGVPVVAWTDIASLHASRVLVSRSRDGGRSWSRPLAVSRVRGQAIQASVAAAGDGTLGITWYDDRRDPGGSSAAWEFDVWFAFSRDGGRSWRRMHLAGPFDMNRSQPLEGVGRRGVGDYQSLAGLPHGFAAVFAQAPPQAKIGASDVFFADLETGPRPQRPGHRR